MKELFTIILLGLSSFLYSQIEFEANNIIIQNEATGKLIIEGYSNKEMYKKEKCDFSRNTPEQKFCIFFNLDTKEELTVFFNPYEAPSNYNKENYLDKMKVYDKKTNFYTLDSKYIFDYGISKDVFIKYINTNEVFPKPIYSTFYMQDFSNKLIIKNMGENFDLGLFLITTNTNRTINYLNKFNKEKIDITLLCTNVLNNIKNRPNENSFFELIDKKYSPFFKNKDETASEVVPKKKVTYNIKKTFHDIINGVVLKKNKVSKEEIIEKYNIPVKHFVKDSLSVKEIIKVNTLNKDFQIIKFYDAKTVIKTNYQTLNNDIVKENNLLTVLIKINFEVFINLYSGKKSDKFPEINKLKPLIQDANGNLNIEKLVKVIKENKSSLSKYLEE
ncbi:hypothetical protein FEZ18_03360 [Oceanihabitans sp. IOP_32]|uniref:hypothetical protein n=1 Tax=Oceanihabitans sp. IOP_32 TaxID=2529032 RepID=UPI0012936422|nr:hypothetical protein [Oceanihabitans sp. IOP_32]QFZ53915.1 hypothetical protein FEZ18_03360 [Oceanihabitans sp. IOP_32]